MPAYNGTALPISSRICRDEENWTLLAISGRTRAATSPKTSHSGFAEPIRRPGISGEKMMRRSVEVSVPPPGDS